MLTGHVKRPEELQEAEAVQKEAEGANVTKHRNMLQEVSCC